VRAAYQNYIATLLRVAEQPEPEKAAENIIAFEMQLAEKHWDRPRNRNRQATYSLKTLPELEQLTRTFSWSRYLKGAGAEKTPGVVLRQLDFFRPSMPSSPKRRLAC
jgi:putative endopeptidase